MLPVLPDLYAAVKSQFNVTHPLPDDCPKEEKFFFFFLIYPEALDVLYFSVPFNHCRHRK